MKFIHPFTTIKKVNLIINNVKDFEDILCLSKEITPKMSLQLKITKHQFSNQDLILPDDYYDNLINNLGLDLVKLQL